MADLAMWQDKKVRADFEGKAKARIEQLQPELEGQAGVVAIEPVSGDHYIGATLGGANARAYKKYPDQWIYFARLDDLDAAIALPTW